MIPIIFLDRHFCRRAGCDYQANHYNQLPFLHTGKFEANLFLQIMRLIA
jgi:hypothetical protein